MANKKKNKKNQWKKIKIITQHKPGLLMALYINFEHIDWQTWEAFITSEERYQKKKK